MNITAVLVVRDEEFFVPLVIPNLLKHVNHIFLLDTGSTDKTIELIQGFQNANPGKIAWEQKDFGGRFPFDNGTAADCHNIQPLAETGAYREMEARNYALDCADKIFDPDWILRVDADESFDALLFDTIRNNPNKTCMGFATELPTFPSPLRLNRSQSDMQQWGTLWLHDPHIFTWNRRKTLVRWRHPLNNHVCLSGNGFNTSDAIIITTPVHFHYHRTFGPKSIYTYLFWERKELERLGKVPTITHYGWDDVTGRKEITRTNIYKTETYKTYLPERFDSQGRFIVSKIVHEAFKDRSTETTQTIDPHILAAWNSFLVYE